MNPVHSGAYGSVCIFASLGLGIIWHPAWIASCALGAFIMWGSGSRGGALNILIGMLFWIGAGGPYMGVMIAIVLLSIGLAVYKKNKGLVVGWKYFLMEISGLEGFSKVVFGESA